MEISADLSKKKYMIAIPAYEGKLQAETALSCLITSGQLTRAGVPHAFNIIRGGALIDAVRNEICWRFLNESDCDVLVCIDADIEFGWETAMERLLVFANHYPIVVGAYCGRTEPPKFIITAYEKKLNEHGLVPIKGIGMGFVAIQRSALEELAKHTPTYNDEVSGKKMHQFFKTGEISEEGNYIGEDIWFFKQAVKHRIIPMLDPAIELKHHGSKVYDFQLKDYVDQLIGEQNGIQES